MILEPFRIIQGIVIVIYISITLIVGIIIGTRYFRTKKREYLLVGISWVGLASPWFPDAISFIVIMLTPTLTFDWYLNAYWNFIVGIGLLAFFLMTWLIALTDLMYKNKKKLILTIGFVTGAIYEVFFYILLFTDISLIGSFGDVFTTSFSLFVIVYSLFVLIVFLITGIQFALMSLKSEKPEHKLKAKFLIFAFIAFVIGALIESSMPKFPGDVLVTKTLLSLSSIAFYIGFIFPEWIKKIFLKEKIIDKKSERI